MKLQHLHDVPQTITHGNLNRQRFIAPGDLKSAVQTVNYVELTYEESYAPHAHPDCEECFFVIEGKADALINDQSIEIKPGDFLVIEPGEVHTFKNKSQETFKYFQFRVLI